MSLKHNKKHGWVFWIQIAIITLCGAFLIFEYGKFHFLW